MLEWLLLHTVLFISELWRDFLAHGRLTLETVWFYIIHDTQKHHYFEQIHRINLWFFNRIFLTNAIQHFPFLNVLLQGKITISLFHRSTKKGKSYELIFCFQLLKIAPWCFNFQITKFLYWFLFLTVWVGWLSEF